MNATFYVAGAVAVIATLMTITRLNAVHALLYLIVSLLSVATVFYTLGAPFVAALEVIIYAGAIMVLFVFVTMMLNLGERTKRQERAWLSAGMWVGPAVLAAALIVELSHMVLSSAAPGVPARVIDPKHVGIALFGPYLIGVELASMLLLAGLVGAYHLGLVGPEIKRLEESERAGSREERDVVGGDLVRSGSDRTTSAA
jgi:NADH-quinone oxidoreductase subunit J